MPPAQRTTRRPAVTPLLLVSALLAASMVACAPPAPSGPLASEIPPDVSIGVQQNRSDYGPRRMQVVVENLSSTALDITSVTLDADQFVEAVSSEDGTTVAAGRTVNIPLSLPGPDCDAEDAAASVTIEFVGADGGRRTATVEPADRFERLPKLRQEDCLRVAVDAVAVLTAARDPEITTVAGVTVASLEIDVAPTGARGALTIDSVSGTTLVAVADPATGAIVPEHPLGVGVDGSDAPSSFAVTLVPNRCDPHAIAEDKLGSILPFRVSTSDAGSGAISIAATDEVRSSLYAFVRAACGV